MAKVRFTGDTFNGRFEYSQSAFEEADLPHHVQYFSPHLPPGDAGFFFVNALKPPATIIFQLLATHFKLSVVNL